MSNIITYRREIDGLRALAVLAVIFFHAGFRTFKGGFVGVDIFFVISGYLITSIILVQRKAGTFSFADFYEHRARRILPALFVVLLSCLPFAWFWFSPGHLKKFSESLISVSCFISNVFFWKQGDYFDTAATLKPLLHTWSLSVEEQYYLIFPIFLILIWRFKKLWNIMIFIFVWFASLAMAQWGSAIQPIATFYLLPTRSWEFLTGSFAVFYFLSGYKCEHSERINQVGSLFGLLLILYSIFIFDEKTQLPSLFALLPTLGAVLVILFATQRTMVCKSLGNKGLVGIGLISYSLYLWHQPLFAFVRYRNSYVEPSKIVFIGLIVIAMILAYLSWKYVEISFRNKKNFNRKHIVLFSIFGSVFFAAIGFTGYFNHGYANRIPQNRTISDIELPKINNGWCFYSIDNINELTYGAKGLMCWLGNKSSDVKGVLFGDSYAGQYEPLLDKVGLDANVKINAITTNWCYPSMDKGFLGPISSRAFAQCIYNRKYFHDHVSQYDFVIFSANWGDILSHNKMDGVFELIRFVSARTKLVILIASPKQFDGDVMDIYARSLLYKQVFDLSRIPAQRDKAAIKANHLLAIQAGRYNNVFFIDRSSIFNVNGNPSDLTKDNLPFSLDGKHISIYGSKSAGDTFLKSPQYNDVKRRLQCLSHAGCMLNDSNCCI